MWRHRIAYRLINTFIAVLAFAGFALIDYITGPSGRNLFSDRVHAYLINNKHWLYIFIVLSYIIQQAWRDMPKPVSMGEVEEFSPIVEQYLAAILEDYYWYLADKYGKIVPVRVNVMLKVRRHSFQEPKLKIMYSLCCEETRYGKVRDNYLIEEIIEQISVTKVCYSLEEKKVMWKRGQGACGHAFETGQPAFYDYKNDKLKSMVDTLTPEQKVATRNVNSVISVPMWLHGRIIGVINMDSRHGIEETRFKDPDIVKMMKSYAASMAMTCGAIFVDGVNIDQENF